METKMETALLAVNGTLMRGLELNPNLLAVGATFVREDATEPCYRLWSIGDRHPAMIRTPGEGAAVAVEVWEVPLAGLAKVLLSEPPGLTIGKVTLAEIEAISQQEYTDAAATARPVMWCASRKATPASRTSQSARSVAVE